MGDGKPESSEPLELRLRLDGDPPWQGSFRGVPVVMTPTSDFGAGGRPTRLRVTRWDSDPELAAFVRDRLGKVEQATIHREAVGRFGSDRVPSKTSLNRFAVRWRLGQDGPRK